MWYNILWKAQLLKVESMYFSPLEVADKADGLTHYGALVSNLHRPYPYGHNQSREEGASDLTVALLYSPAWEG